MCVCMCVCVCVCVWFSRTFSTAHRFSDLRLASAAIHRSHQLIRAQRDAVHAAHKPKHSTNGRRDKCTRCTCSRQGFEVISHRFSALCLLHPQRQLVTADSAYLGVSRDLYGISVKTDSWVEEMLPYVTWKRRKGE